MKHFLFSVQTTIILLLTCLTASCGDSPEYDEGREFDAKIIGNWVSADGNDLYTFDNDSQHSYTHTILSPFSLEEGQWWTRNGYLNMLRTDRFAVTYRFSASANELRLTPVGTSGNETIVLYRP